MKLDDVHPIEAQPLSDDAAKVEVMLHEKNGRDIADMGQLGATKAWSIISRWVN